MNYTGLYFGSFNPIHHGHLTVARYFASASDIQEVWLIVSPHNPHKESTLLAPAEHRLRMAELAVAAERNIRVSDIEFHLPTPSYTCFTLRALQTGYPDKRFAIILGEDSLRNFSKWKQYQYLLENFPIRIFPRSGSHEMDSSIDWSLYDIQKCNAPLVDISSTQLRKLMMEGKSIAHLLPTEVNDYITEKGLYLR